MNVKEAANLVAFAAAAKPQYQEKDLAATAKSWAVLLVEMDFETGLMALSETLRSKNYWPEPADLIAAARSLRTDTPPAAEIAWLEVLENMKRCKAEPWKNPLLDEAVRCLGGLRHLGMTENISIERAHFFKIYNSLLERRRIDEERPIVATITGERLIKIMGGIKQCQTLTK